MKTLLALHTSINGRKSLSSSLASDYQKRWRRAHPDGRVIVRDLADDSIPHLTAAAFAAFAGAGETLNDAQRAALSMSDELIAELRQADEVIVAVPMYNFGIPSVLKAYFDHVARAGETFRYTASGPEGLLTGKRVTIFATRGGSYVDTDMDVQSRYLDIIFTFLGFDAPRFVYAEGTAMGEDALASALAGARARIDALSVARTAGERA